MATVLVVATTVRPKYCYYMSELQEPKAIPDRHFFTAATASFVLFLDNLFFSTKRWRQLRSGAGSLESIIWFVKIDR